MVLLTGCLVGDIFGGDQSDLDENRERWRAAGIASYSYRVDRSCFCGFFGPAEVTVVDGIIVAVQTFLPNTTDVDSNNFDYFDTVEDLFDMVDSAIDQGAHRLEVRYDEEWGFPVRISIDYFKNAIDDEITLIVTRFTPTVS